VHSKKQTARAEMDESRGTPRSFAIAAKVLLAALFCCPDAGSLSFVMTTRRLGATPPWDGATVFNPRKLVNFCLIQRPQPPAGADSGRML
jgi:hypothetical protein